MGEGVLFWVTEHDVPVPPHPPLSTAQTQKGQNLLVWGERRGERGKAPEWVWTTAPWFALHGVGRREPAADQPSAQPLIFQVEKLRSGDGNSNSPHWSVGRCVLHWPTVPASHRAHFLLTPPSVAGALWVCSTPLLFQDPGFPVIMAEGTRAPGGSHGAIMTPGHVPTYWLEANPKEARKAIPRMPRRRRSWGCLGTAQMSLQPGHCSWTARCVLPEHQPVDPLNSANKAAPWAQLTIKGTVAQRSDVSWPKPHTGSGWSWRLNPGFLPLGDQQRGWTPPRRNPRHRLTQ